MKAAYDQTEERILKEIAKAKADEKATKSNSKKVIARTTVSLISAFKFDCSNASEEIKKRLLTVKVKARQDIKSYIVSGVVELIGSKRLEVSHVSSFRQVTSKSQRQRLFLKQWL